MKFTITNLDLNVKDDKVAGKELRSDVTLDIAPAEIGETAKSLGIPVEKLLSLLSNRNNANEESEEE